MKTRRMKTRRKGQLSYVMKPVVLVMTVILLILLLYSLNSYKVREKTAQKNLDLVGSATNILLILANSEDCLAYRVPNVQGAYANVIDAKKLDEFTIKYAEIEPECARNYDFGWKATVEELDTNGKTTKKWVFGAKEFSQSKTGLKNSVDFWMPVAIRHSETSTQPGKISIFLVDGELEKIAGFLDWSCKMGMYGRIKSTSTDVQISAPITYDSSTNKLCIGSKTKACRAMLCNILSFDDMKASGTYNVKIEFKTPGSLSVSV